MSQPEQQRSQSTDQDEPGLLDLLIVLAKYKWLVLGLPILVALASAAIALLLPNIYTGTTKVLPPQQAHPSSAVLAQLGSLAGLVGGPSAPTLKNPTDLYVGMLKSRTVADNLIKRFDLNTAYEQELQSGTRRQLTTKTTIIAGKDGIITIEVDDENPERAAALANGYVEELLKLTKTLALTEASQRRLFFEQQLVETKAQLAKAEASARQALEAGGLVLVENQGRVMAQTTARLRAEITLKEVQIGSMRAFATPDNPELRRYQQEVEVMRRELARIEGTSGMAKLPSNRVPNGSGIDNLGLLRELKYHEATYELLAKQLEIAKIDEAKDLSLIQVLDKAIVPDRKSKPVRSRIVLASTLGAGLLSLLMVWLLEGLTKSAASTGGSERWQALRRHIALRSSPNRRI